MLNPGDPRYHIRRGNILEIGVKGNYVETWHNTIRYVRPLISIYTSLTDEMTILRSKHNQYSVTTGRAKQTFHVLAACSIHVPVPVHGGHSRKDGQGKVIETTLIRWDLEYGTYHTQSQVWMKRGWVCNEDMREQLFERTLWWGGSQRCAKLGFCRGQDQTWFPKRPCRMLISLSMK